MVKATPSAAVRGRPSSREAMLDAAETVVVKHGAVRLTLDAVAKQAKASKGGVMYHFPSKEALLQALVTRAIERSHAARENLQPTSPDPGQPTRQTGKSEEHRGGKKW